MLVIALLACSPVPGDWSTMFTPVEVDCAPGAQGGSQQPEAAVADADPAFEAMRQRQACMDDPFSAACLGEDKEEAPVELVQAPVESVQAPVEAPQAPVELVQAPTGPLPPPVGLASQPAWGVRLLSTLPHAQPPRAALGLPDGTEVIVSPGSMLPEAGIIVVSVGNNNAQLAKVTPEGDHAEIETVTLQAAYGLSDGG